MRAIDYGRGSIVDREKKKNGKMYYLSFLNAGERNYKYKENKYFPFLYGLFEIEQKANKKQEDPTSYKTSFVQQLAVLLKVDEHDREKLTKLCDENITSQYKSVLLKDAWFYTNRGALDESIILAEKIMQ